MQRRRRFPPRPWFPVIHHCARDGTGMAWHVESSNRIRGEGQVKWMNRGGGFVIYGCFQK